MNTSSKVTRVALFDFCGTLVNFQTGDAFVKFVLGDLTEENFSSQQKENNENGKCLIHMLHDVVFSTPLSKTLLAKRIKDIQSSFVDRKAKEYATKLLYPNIIKETWDLLNECRKNEMYVVLVSAAYGVYLNEFSKRAMFDAILSSNLGIKNGKMTGKIIDDTVGKRKAVRVKKYLNAKFGKNGYVIEISVGDSKSDMPILDLAKKAIVISKKHQPWVKNNYEEIIYEH